MPDAEPTTRPNSTAPRTEPPAEVHDRFRQKVRRRHGTDGWLLELLAPLRHVRVGRFSIGESAEAATFCLRHLREDRAGQIAATLAFRTLFGLVPVLVVVTLAAKAMLGADFESTMTSLFHTLGMQNVTMSIPSVDGAGEATNVSLADWLGRLVASASTVSVMTLGWTGFVLVAFSAIWVLTTIEEAFNIIFRCEHGRSWVRRMLVYWFALTAGPLVLGATPVLLTRIGRVAEALAIWEWVGASLKVVLSLAILWVGLLVAYVTIPATKVAWKPAMIGALVSAILLQIGKGTFGLYVANAFSVSALSGSLGLVPLFMFWVYLMWLVILFGAEIAALVQAIRGRSKESDPLDAVHPEAVIDALRCIAARFSEGKSVTLAEVTAVSRLPSLVAVTMVDRCEELGLVRRIGDGGSVMLARPAESVSLGELLDIAWESADGREPADPLTRKLRDGQRAALEGLTLADETPGA